MQHTVRDKAMTLSKKSHDSEQNLRWLAWERKNSREDRIAQKRMTLVFGIVGLILLILLLHGLRQVSGRPDLVEKGPTVAQQWRTGPLRYCLECGKSLKPA
jgi:lipopolysaccharide/colanic/teichoic acid biosynthesis glycosyltransferase